MNIDEASKKTGKTYSNIIKLCQRGHLKAVKNSKGEWVISENSLTEYFNEEPKSPDWYPLKTASDLLGIPSCKLKNLGEEGKIRAKKHKNKWFFCMKNIRNLQNFYKKREKKEKIVTLKGNFVVKNRAGIHCRPSCSIIALKEKYSLLRLDLKTKDVVFDNVQTVFDLLSINIQKGTKVKYSATATETKAKNFIIELKDAVKNRFDVNH